MNIKLPWNSDLDICDDQLEILWEKTIASDYYFAIGPMNEYDPEPFVIINPKEFYDREGHWYDQHLGIHHLLPDNMGCAMESIYEFTCSVEEIRQEMISRGFIENQELAVY
jgi:hypothetical protein